MSNDSPITTEEKNRVIAEWLGFRFEADREDINTWHAPDCKCESEQPCDKCTCLDLCFAFDDNPDFYQSEEASALILEKLPSPTLAKETLHAPTWICWAQSMHLVPDDYVRHADRKTCIAEAAYQYVSREAERAGSNQATPQGRESTSSSSLSSEKKDIKETR